MVGSGGAGVYRNSIQKRRYVDDYPTVNLIINKDDFNKVNGFDEQYWPGEDTILCLKLTKELNKKILYSPMIKVFHHRREAIIPHLQQIKRYAIHRGLFAKKFPQTSFRIGYLIPSLFTLYIALLIPTNIFINKYNYLLNFPLYLYISILLG
jgi:GT2 family glycosyltransferase